MVVLSFCCRGTSLFVCLALPAPAAPTCGPCRTLKPIMAKVIADYPGKVRLRQGGVADEAARQYRPQFRVLCRDEPFP